LIPHAAFGPDNKTNVRVRLIEVSMGWGRRLAKLARNIPDSRQTQ
jgi:hypothetical protein